MLSIIDIYTPKHISTATIMYELIFILFCSSIISGLSYQHFSTIIDNRKYPPPGHFIDVGGHKLHYVCTGKQGPSVVFDGGLGADLNWWDLVQKKVSQFAKVCTFDRAGYGWSEASNSPRTSRQIVLELHTLLHKIKKISPPYILVGHSFGGVNMRLYANTYPDEVHGLILVDACHENQHSENDVSNKDTFQALKNLILDSIFFHYMGISRWRMAQTLKPFFSPLMSQALQKMIIAKASSIKSLKTRDNEMNLLKKSLYQLKKSKNCLLNKPLAVITAEESNQNESWSQYQKNLASLSKHGKQIIASGSSHMINIDRPDIIIQEIYNLTQ